MKNLTSLTIVGLNDLAMITTMTATTKSHIADAEENCRALEDGTVVCSGGGSFGNVPGGGGRHTIEEPDGDTTRSGGGGLPGSNEEFIVMEAVAK